MWRNNIGLLFLITIALFSCKSSEMLTGGAATSITDARLRNQLILNELAYNKLYLKKIQFTLNEGDNKKSFRGSFVVQRDSQIVVSIFALMGIELVRARLTPTEVIILDKHSKVATKSNYAYFNKKFGVELDFYTIQAIISNSIFVYPSVEDKYDELKKYKHYIDKNSYVFKSLKENRLDRLMGRGKQDFILHEMYIYPDLFRIFNVYINDFSKQQSIDIRYSKFKNFGTTQFPEQIKFTAIQSDKKFMVDLNINYLEINDGGSLHFKIPSAYKIKSL
ncbi:protein of unknown function [Saccharicrinis carchari]|uniref:DUF4292 domain-containing protein n=1 Tax=Saccharicrinis carchari TaxID=1168039 RepID=A0A521CIU7_SACCC|nr:DUF4292 domain-containing protein [Saccharicrinis carchari]SMO58620.1 protein of unknown function [Saccharicrinis carchari]